MSLSGSSVLFFAGPLYEDLELWYPKIRLEEEGASCVVAVPLRITRTTLTVCSCCSERRSIV